MKKLLYCVLLVGVCGVMSGSQDKTDYGVAPPVDLSLNLEIVQQSYCNLGDEEFIVGMEVKLKFTNISDHNVILSRKIENPVTVRAAKTAEAGKNHDFESDPNADFFTAHMPPSAPRFGKSPEAKYFVTLAPKESYETTVQSGLTALFDAALAPKHKGLLTRGAHVLQLGVNVWPYDWPYFTARTDKEVLAKRWRNFGRLETGFIYSDFLPFTIPEKFESPRCK
jgi:hypothetical protein